jgi:serine/threonine protein kinase/WD40 repeat protein
MAEKPEPPDGTLVRGDVRVARDETPTLVRDREASEGGTLQPEGATLVRSHGDADDGPVTPETPGRYIVKSEVGRGGQSRVQLVVDSHLGREIALKELLVESEPLQPDGATPISQTTAAAARFLREARITGQLEHPNIVPVYELGQHPDGSLYYTQKLVRGASFKSALQAARTLPGRLKLLSHFSDICHAVAYAHSRGVIHRDLKPENVVLGEFGETVVLDWGLAKARGQKDLQAKQVAREALLLRSPDATVEGHALGTPSYMSPEQALGKLDQIDERSDVWSLGAILYEILTGEPPFRGDTAYSVIGKVIHDPVRPVRALLPGAPPELASVAERALSRDKALRYPSASELAQEIEAFQAGRNVAAYAYSSLDLFRRFVQKNRALTVVSALALVLVLAALVAVGREYRKAQGYMALLRGQMNDAHANLAQAFLEKARAAERDLLWHRAEIFYAAARVQQDLPEARWGILVEGEDASGVMRIGGPAGDLRAVRFSPDGEACATGSGDGTVRIFSIDTGRELWRFQAPAQIDAVAWSADGALLASRDALGAVRVHDVKSGARVASAVCVQPRGDLAFAGDALYASCAAGTLRIPLAAGASLGSGGGAAAGSAPGTAAVSAPGTAAVSAPGTAAVSAPGTAAVSAPGSGTIAAAERLPPSQGVAACGGKVWLAQSRGLSSLDGAVSIPLPEGRHELACGGARVAASLDDRSIGVWDERGVQQASLRGNGDVITHLALSPDGARLASASEDRTVRLWDVATGRQTALLQRPARTLWVDFDRAGDRLAVGEQQSAVLLWDVTEGEQGVTGQLPEFAFLPDGSYLAAGEGGVIGRWTADARLLAKLPDDGPVESLAILGSAQAAAVVRGQVHLWDLATQRRARTLAASKPVRKVLAAGGRLVADLGDRVVLLDPETTLSALDGPVEQWTATGTLLVALVGGRVQRFELPSGRALAPVALPASAVALSPDGSTLAVGTYGKALLLDTATLRPIGELPMEGAVPLSLAFSADGALLAASGMEGAVRLFEVASRREVENLPVAAARLVRGLRFSPDGRRLRLETVGSTSTLGGVRFVRLNDPAALPDPQRGLTDVLRDHGVALDGTAIIEVPPPVLAH